MNSRKFTSLGPVTRLFLLITVLVCFSGCSMFGLFGKDEVEDPEIAADESAAKLYNKGNELVLSGEFPAAIEQFEKLRARYPFGRYSQHAQLELAYAYYQQSKFEQAASSVNQFIKLNPQHPNIDYAYYMKGVIAFDSGKNLIHYVVRRDPSNNDPTSLLESFNIFKSLIENYPDSKYSEDAKERMIFLRNELAEYELKVAKYYMQRGAYVATANRAKYIMENYQGAEVMPETLFVLHQAYYELGMEDLASDTQRVYVQNFQAGKKGGVLNEDYLPGSRQCAEGLWDKFLEKIRARTYYCN